MGRNVLSQAWHFLTRMDVAAVLIVMVLLLATLGSCFPQLSSSVAVDAERLARWETSVRARYGTLTDSLAASGAFRWFRSPGFLVPLTLLAVATLVCALDRWRLVWRRAFRQPVRPSDTAFDATPHTARLTAPTATAVPHLMRKVLEQRGFRVRSETTEGNVYLRGDRNRLAPLATLVTHLAVLLLLLGQVLTTGYGWQEELTIGPGETTDVGHGNRLALRNEGFAIARYADGSVAAYAAEVALIEGNQEVARGGVRVNEPLTYAGIGFHLAGYGEREGRYSVTLLAVRDPGYSPVIAAGFLLLLGLTVSFNFPHCWIHVQIESEGTLRLVGRAGRRACDFEREFAALVEELKREVLQPVKDRGESPC